MNSKMNYITGDGYFYVRNRGSRMNCLGDS